MAHNNRYGTETKGVRKWPNYPDSNQAWVKVPSQHTNADNYGYLHFRKSENTDFYQYSQMFGDVSKKFEDM